MWFNDNSRLYTQTLHSIHEFKPLYVIPIHLYVIIYMHIYIYIYLRMCVFVCESLKEKHFHIHFRNTLFLNANWSKALALSLKLFVLTVLYASVLIFNVHIYIIPYQHFNRRPCLLKWRIIHEDSMQKLRWREFMAAIIIWPRPTLT